MAKADGTPSRPSSRREELFFRHLLQSPEFIEIAHVFKRLNGLSMALHSPRSSQFWMGLTGDRGSPLCQLIRANPEGNRRCEACDRRHNAQAGAEGQAKLYTCHAGLLDMAIPILIQGEHMATLSSGQVLPEPKSAAAFARMARRLRWLGVSTQRLRAAYNGAPCIPRDQLKQMMHLLEIFSRQMCDSARRIRELEASLEHPAIRPARELVEERFREAELTLAEAASRAGLSPNRFSHVFHRETGVTFTHYVHARRIEEAKHLLAETDKRITEICFACGFNSLTHFNRVFRRGTGCSPRQYRLTRHHTVPPRRLPSATRFNPADRVPLSSVRPARLGRVVIQTD